MAHIRVCTGTFVEICSSSCEFGCKVHACEECGHRIIRHVGIYGHDFSGIRDESVQRES